MSDKRRLRDLAKVLLENPIILENEEMEEHHEAMAKSLYSRETTRKGRTFEEVKKSVALTAVEFAVSKIPGWMMNPMEYVAGDPTTWAFDCVSDTGETMECKRWKKNYGMLTFRKEHFRTFLDVGPTYVDYLFAAEVVEDDEVTVVYPRLLCDAPSFETYIGASRFDPFKNGDAMIYRDSPAVRDSLAYVSKKEK